MKKAFRLLIVDDQPRTRQSMKALFEINFPQIALSEASNGFDALQCAEDHRPDIIVMDARMPEMDGIEATRLIKAKYPQTQIIVLSMYERYQTAALVAGADSFVVKGESPELLLAAIATYIGTFPN